MNNGFDRVAVCASSGNGGNANKPDKYNGVKQGQCCGKGLGRHTFNPAKLQCCADGTTKKIGACTKY